MSGRANRKVVTSGRLTGSAGVSLMSPGEAALPEPVYSLYSTDSEDQVTTLHKDLDQCADLLNGILQMNQAALPGLPTTKSRQSPPGKKAMKKLLTKTASVGLPKTVKGGAAKSRPLTSQRKAATRKLPPKSDHKGSVPDLPGPGHPNPQRRPFSSPATHSGVRLHPPQKRALQFHSPAAQKQRLQHLPNSVPPLQSSVSPVKPVKMSASVSGPEAPKKQSEEECDREEELVPVKDTNIQSSATHPQTTVTHPHLHLDVCTLNLELGPEPGQELPGECCTETEVKAKMVRYLLEELKTLITGRGSVAERLLGLLEQTVTSLPMTAGSSGVQAESVADAASLRSQSTLISRLGGIQDEQAKEREGMENYRTEETLGHLEVLSLQEELITAQSRLQELQDDFTELRKALQDTQIKLKDIEAENVLIKTDLEDTTRRLQESEQEKSELTRLAQQRLEETVNLKRLFQTHCSSFHHKVVDDSLSVTNPPHKQDPGVHPSADYVNQYLMSLRQMEHPEYVHTAAQTEGNKLREKSLHHRVSSRQSDASVEVLSHCQNQNYKPSSFNKLQSCGETGSQEWLNSTSQCDVESVWSQWSMKTGSTFNTRDEVAFQDGLAALDASIASLQKTIQLDLRK